MKHVLPVVIGLSVVAAAAWVVVSQFPAPPQLPASEKAKVPVYLRRRADCMYQALKAIPGVKQPLLRYENKNGWNHPVLSYLATWRDGVYQMAFQAQKPMAGHDGVLFLQSFAGPPPPGLDIALMGAVMKSWKDRCQADVDFEIN